jgi:hypothetical protein
MHNLDRSIAEWRKDMSRTRGLGPDTLDELESHLRETIHALVESGIPEQEALQRTISQLGPAGDVTAEFQKLSPATWLPVKVVRVIAGVLSLVIVAEMVLFFQQHAWDAWLCAHVFAQGLSHVTEMLLWVLGICFVIQRSFADFSTRRAEALVRVVHVLTAWACGLTLLSLIFGMGYSQRTWGRLWNWHPTEISGLCVLLWRAGFLAVQRYRRPSVRSLFVASLAGNSIVLMSVYGLVLFALGVHVYDRAILAHWPFLLLLTVNALLILVGLAPAGWLRVRKGVVS